MKLHHFGIATKDIKKCASVYESMGYKSQGNIIFDNDRNLNILFMSNGDTRVELIEKASVEEKSPIDAFLDKGVNHNIYHSCYAVSDIENMIDNLKKAKFVLVEQPKPAIAFNGKRVCFLYNFNVGMIELCEI